MPSRNTQKIFSARHVGEVLETEFPELSHTTEWRYRETYKKISAKLSTSEQIAGGDVLAAAYPQLAGKDVTAIWREFGIIRQPKHQKYTPPKNRLTVLERDERDRRKAVARNAEQFGMAAGALIETPEQDRKLLSKEQAEAVLVSSVAATHFARERLGKTNYSKSVATINDQIRQQKESELEAAKSKTPQVLLRHALNLTPKHEARLRKAILKALREAP